MAARRASVKSTRRAAGRAAPRGVPPQIGGVTIVVALVHDDVERRSELAVLHRIGEIALLDQTLEAPQFCNILLTRRATAVRAGVAIDSTIQEEIGRDVMTSFSRNRGLARALRFAAALTSVTALVGTSVAAYAAPPVDLSKWSPEYVRSIAGTEDFDTAAECSKVVPLDYKGRLTYWYTRPTDAEPEITHKMDTDFWGACGNDLPEHRQTDEQNIDYDSCSTSSAPHYSATPGQWSVRLQILGGVEFASKGYFRR